VVTSIDQLADDIAAYQWAMLASSNTIDGQQSVESGHSVATRFCDVISCALVVCSARRSVKYNHKMRTKEHKLSHTNST
jgi:hypothetical protein